MVPLTFGVASVTFFSTGIDPTTNSPLVVTTKGFCQSGKTRILKVPSGKLSK